MSYYNKKKIISFATYKCCYNIKLDYSKRNTYLFLYFFIYRGIGKIQINYTQQFQILLVVSFHIHIKYQNVVLLHEFLQYIRIFFFPNAKFN